MVQGFSLRPQLELQACLYHGRWEHHRELGDHVQREHLYQLEGLYLPVDHDQYHLFLQVALEQLLYQLVVQLIPYLKEATHHLSRMVVELPLCQHHQED